MKEKHINVQTANYYNQKIIANGVNPKGVDWNGEAAQNIRFAQLVKVFNENDSRFSLNDLGCGYGALVNYLLKKGSLPKINYRGYDISSEMISAAKKSQSSRMKSVRFFRIGNVSQVKSADYTVASGIFNVRQSNNLSTWKKYTLDVLKVMDTKSKLGFSFNMLTSYSDIQYRKRSLFYADPTWVFDYCKRNFSKDVALLHDYSLYDFTIIVRKNASGL